MDDWAGLITAAGHTFRQALSQSDSSANALAMTPGHDSLTIPWSQDQASIVSEALMSSCVRRQSQLGRLALMQNFELAGLAINLYMTVPHPFLHPLSHSSDPTPLPFQGAIHTDYENSMKGVLGYVPSNATLPALRFRG